MIDYTIYVQTDLIRKGTVPQMKLLRHFFFQVTKRKYHETLLKNVSGPLNLQAWKWYKDNQWLLLRQTE